MVESYAYTPWGEIRIFRSGNGLGTSNPFTYDGREGVLADTGTRLHWMRARWYSPAQSRFVSVDPMVGRAGTADTAYGYAANDPINNADPLGTMVTRRATFMMGGGGAAAGVRSGWGDWCDSDNDERKAVCRTAYTATARAEFISLSWYPITTSKWGGHNAFRHAYWSLRLTDKLEGLDNVTVDEAVSYARKWTNMHEAFGGYKTDSCAVLADQIVAGATYKNSADTRADCKNNSAGFTLGRSSVSGNWGDTKQVKRTFEAMRDGKLFWWKKRNDCGAPSGRSCGGDDGYNGQKRATNETDIATGACAQLGITDC